VRIQIRSNIAFRCVSFCHGPFTSAHPPGLVTRKHVI
jgi:hypothetical protein